MAEVPPEAEWFANLTSSQTPCAYEAAMKDFIAEYLEADGRPEAVPGALFRPIRNNCTGRSDS